MERASPNTISNLAPPSDLMPPAALISLIAISAPSRPRSPSWASAPVTGWRMPTFTTGVCARRIDGAATGTVTNAAAAAPAFSTVRREIPEIAES